jgi:hypothetical protein
MIFGIEFCVRDVMDAIGTSLYQIHDIIDAYIPAFGIEGAPGIEPASDDGKGDCFKKLPISVLVEGTIDENSQWRDCRHRSNK